jgi:hypothetical protein
VHIRPTAFLNNPIFTWFAAPALRERNELVPPFGNEANIPDCNQRRGPCRRSSACRSRKPFGDIYELTGPVSLDIDGLAAEYALPLQRPMRSTDIPQDTWVAEVLEPLDLPAYLDGDRFDTGQSLFSSVGLTGFEPATT